MVGRRLEDVGKTPKNIILMQLRLAKKTYAKNVDV
jgi:hypothetical protein